MRNNQVSRWLYVLTVTITVEICCSGCASMGNSSRFTLDSKFRPTIQNIRSDLVSVGSVTMEPNAARLINIGTYAMGNLSATDITNIRDSLQDTLVSWQLGTTGSETKQLYIYVVIKRYLVQTTNTGGAVLALIAWCAAYDSSNILFHEEFYATSQGYLVYPINAIKDMLHKAIMIRILSNALLLSSHPEGGFQPVQADNTFLSYEDAVKSLPAGLVSAAGAMGFVWPAGYTKLGWDWTQHPERLDWPKIIASQEKVK